METASAAVQQGAANGALAAAAAVVPEDAVDKVAATPGGGSNSSPTDLSLSKDHVDQTPLADASRPAAKVVLRMEVATKLQARILTWSVIVLNVFFVILAVALFGVENQNSLLASEVHDMYWGRLGIAIACMAALLFIAVWYFLAFRSSQLEGRVWSQRQQYFGWTAAWLMALQLCHAGVVMASLIATVAQPECGYPWITLQVMQFLQWTFLSASIFFLLARMKNMVLWRGDGALDMHSDYRLLVDRPFKDKAKSYWLIAAIWLVLEGVTLAGMITRIVRLSGLDIPVFPCNTDLKQFNCGRGTMQVVSSIVAFLVIVAMVIAWVLAVRRAVRDHEQLPFHHYRATHIYVRVNGRVVTPVFTAVIVSLLFMTVIPSFQGNCVSAANSQVGNITTLLSMVVAAAVMAILYMPKAQALDSPLLQEFLQDFSWTQGGMPSAIEARNQRLMDSEAPTDGATKGHQTAEGMITGVLTFLPGAAMAGVAKMTGVQDMGGALQQLRKEPMFCVETACRLFYWTRLSYRREENLDYEFVNAATAKRLFDLEQHQTVWDDKTDTHCVLGWSGSTVVLAFRGTASLQNAMTDLKAWKMVLPPVRRVRGQVVKVHAGFGNAWLNDGFNTKVVDKLREIDQARKGSEPLRFWITGHSLGGALAILASVEVRREFPDSQISCYTWGAPRVGNSAFTTEQEEGVPDTWAILNGMDPIPWIPKGGFKRAGKRVTINPQGDLILRPSYFETSIMQRGTITKHHMTSNYGLSLAALFKAQFAPSKAFPGGAEGVRQLVATLDLGEALVLKNVDGKSLENPEVLPVGAEGPAGSKKRLNSGKTMFDDCGAGCGGGKGCGLFGGKGAGGRGGGGPG